jgi:hypothetical protein
MLFLLIENPGVAPVEGFTMLGVSTTRMDSSSSNLIGQFGSGAKQAVGLLLRHDINPTVYCGTRKLEFHREPKPVTDGLLSHEYGAVVCNMSGKDERSGKSGRVRQELGFVLEHGVHDWDNLAMAIREFVSNALDRATRETGTWRNAVIDVVDESKMRAKAGHTRVFVPLAPEISKIHRELPKRFLHLGEPDSLTKRVLLKTDRNMDGRKSAAIYRNGVFVRQIDDERPSLFDYNLGDDLRMDESRNVNDSSCEDAASVALANADAATLVTLFRAIVDPDSPDYWEKDFSSYDLIEPIRYGSSEKIKAIKEKWQAAWKLAVGDGVACMPIDYVVDSLASKGYRTITVRQSNWYEVLQRYGITTDVDVMTKDEREGKQMLPPTDDTLAVANEIWGELEARGMTNGKLLPGIRCYMMLTDNGGKQTLGYHLMGTSEICIHADIATGRSAILHYVMLEELAHYITQAGDFTRDFQNFAFGLAAKLLMERQAVEA